MKKISLTVDEIVGIIARVLEGRAVLVCPCGACIQNGTRKDFEPHIKHVLQWGSVPKDEWGHRYIDHIMNMIMDNRALASHPPFYGDSKKKRT